MDSKASRRLLSVSAIDSEDGRRLLFLSMAGTMMILFTLVSLGIEEVDSSQVNMTSPNKTRITLKVSPDILG
jgi:hypothetical protein